MKNIPLIGVAVACLVGTAGSSRAQISSNGLTLWLRSDLGVTRTAAGTVSAWVDQSPAGHNVSQTDARQCPLWVSNALNALPALHFQGRRLQRSGVVASNLFSRMP